MAWSQHLAAMEQVSTERLRGWQAHWVPYADLSEEAKELDRVWAERILDLLDELGLIHATARRREREDGGPAGDGEHPDCRRRHD